MPADFQPEPILEALVRHGVEFVAIGGFAAILQGSPFPTDDVDITPKADHENLARLSAALKELGARVRAQGTDEDGLPLDHDADSLGAARVWNLTTPYGHFDITFDPTGTQGYDDLRRDAIEVDLHGTTVKIASLADIIRSKNAANRPKDQRMLPVLREVLAEQSAQRRQRNRPG
jgi:hypothetical protein